MQALEIICDGFLANLKSKYLKNIKLRNTLRGANPPGTSFKTHI
jgi:hypothetical protein